LYINHGMRYLNISAKCMISFNYQSLTKFNYSEALREDKTFPHRDLAASIASKVFYYLEEYEESLRLALEAGSKFDLNERS
jgi:26S proteasome regulatory subunit N2